MRPAVLAAAAVAALAVPAVASAHATMQEATPAVQGRVEASPKEVTLRFDQSVEAPPNALVVLAPDGRRLSGAVTQSDRATMVRVPVRGAVRGQAYTVRWRVVSADGHITTGVFTFGVGVPAPPPTEAVGASGVTWRDDAARWALFASLALMIGVVGIRLLVLPRDIDPRVERRVYLLGTLGAFLALNTGIAGFVIRSANAIQVSGVDLLYADLSPFAESTRFGTAFLVTTFGFGICLTILLLAWVLDMPLLRWPAFLLGLVLVWGYPLSGHQATEPNSTPLTEVADWVHLVTAMLWVGGVLTLAVVVWPLAPDLRRAAFLRFSRIAVVLIALLLAAGTVVAIARLPDPLRPLDDVVRPDAPRQDRARLRRARLGWVPPHVRPPAPRARRDAARGRPEPARRERRRAGRAVRGGGARQRRPAAGRDGLDERASRPARPVGDRLTFRAVLVAISGGAGFLGLHLARRLVADGHAVRTLDLAPLDDAALEGQVEELRGDVRLAARRPPPRRGRGRAGARGRRTADPGEPGRDPVGERRGRGRDARSGAREAGVRRVVLISSTAVYGVPERHPIDEDDPLVGVGHYGESKIDAERLCAAFARRGLETVIVRPKTFVGPERLGVFEILFDWIREGRRIPILGDGANRYQLLAVEDLVDAVVLCLEAPCCGRGAERRRCALRDGTRGPRRPDRARRVRIAAASPCPRGRRRSPFAASSSRGSRRSPSGTTGRRTRTRSSRSPRPATLLGWEPRLSNAETLCATYDWYLGHRDQLGSAGLTHRVPWDQRALGVLKRLV